MNIGKYVNNYVSCKNFSTRQLAEKLGMDHKELDNKIKSDELTAKELVSIGSILYMDLEQMRLELTYDNVECEYYVYVPIEIVSEEDLAARDYIDVKKFRVCKVNDINEEEQVLPVFEPTIDKNGEEKYLLKMRQVSTMVKVKNDLYKGMPVAYCRIKKVGEEYKLEEKYYVPNRQVCNSSTEVKVIRI